ncbi:MAG: hypothetical protein O9972_35460 [Burkholderiales bacterium]|nr:hypothetical protein [Burkholderiales bacterium]
MSERDRGKPTCRSANTDPVVGTVAWPIEVTVPSPRFACSRGRSGGTLRPRCSASSARSLRGRSPGQRRGQAQRA